MQGIVIKPKSKKSGLFLQKLLSQLNKVKSLEIIEEKEEKPFVELSDSSLQKNGAATQTIFGIAGQRKY
ncbi:hypothetical protein [Roseimarinus sediminis]|uniref:hypothetical protein n=1 Tax=Roseimarinus sediminis TaxID=1610899 RepID=UPI003D210372